MSWSDPGRNGEAVRWLTAAAEPAVLMVDIASFRQEVLAGAGISTPAPLRPGHPHPMQPWSHQNQAWWECLRGGLVRPWRPGGTT